jgi:hypothetical protein
VDNGRETCKGEAINEMVLMAEVARKRTKNNLTTDHGGNFRLSEHKE